MENDIDIDGIRRLVGDLSSPRFVGFLGNLGDALIRFATFAAVHDVPTGPSESAASATNFSPVIHGGGHLTPPWGRLESLISDVDTSTAGVILPHTVRGAVPALLRRSALVVIARERTTFESLLAGGLPRSRVLIGHDMAFSLENHFRDLRRTDGQGTLIALRSDAEAVPSTSRLQEFSFDLSAQITSHWSSKSLVEAAATAFVNIVSSYQFIVTDRLHVAIAAALTGRDCWMLPNSYGKNRAVFEHSLAPRFPSVRWSDGLVDVPPHVVRRLEPTRHHHDRWMSDEYAQRARSLAAELLVQARSESRRFAGTTARFRKVTQHGSRAPGLLFEAARSGFVSPTSPSSPRRTPRPLTIGELDDLLMVCEDFLRSGGRTITCVGDSTKKAHRVLIGSRRIARTPSPEPDIDRRVSWTPDLPEPNGSPSGPSLIVVGSTDLRRVAEWSAGRSDPPTTVAVAPYPTDPSTLESLDDLLQKRPDIGVERWGRILLLESGSPRARG